jgi:carboxypeptidase Taq
VYQELCEKIREVATLGSSIALLSWDQETMMPARAAGTRAEELSLLSRLAHERATADHLNELLSACEADPELTADDEIGANLREMRRDYDRAKKLPSDLIAEFSETTSHALEAWKSARGTSDFATFSPWLKKVLELNRRKAGYYGVPDGGEPYDALLDEFEPGVTSQQVEAVFKPLREALVPLIDAIAAAPTLDNRPNEIEVPIATQRAFHEELISIIGFDVEAGRLDLSTHPFSTGIAPGDTRITTRFTPAGVAEALSSTLHEAGHGMYEQGLPKDRHRGQPLGEALGLAIHESQSRLWENQIGRSRPFWNWLTPRLTAAFGPEFQSFDAEQMYRAANIVRPNLIRVESDEATYNLHIMLRFDLERAMLRGDLAVDDLPDAWNERMKNDLGLEVPDNARGCLQDIHWSMGAVGYFPTYTLGSVYAAQFWSAMQKALPNVEAEIENGDYSNALGWLRTNIHARGRHTPAEALCRQLTGEPLNHEPLIAYLHDKLGGIYGLSGALAR